MNILSNTFLVSFFVFFIIYWLLAKNLRIQNILILIASYVFYSLINWKFSFLLFFTTSITYLSAIYISREKKGSVRRFILSANIIANIGILFIFKYYDFFASEIVRVIGLNPDKVLLNLILPVGISFYTFVAIGYIIDVYKGKSVACTNAINYFSFISFFPLIMSGPIERSDGLLPQFGKRRGFSYPLFIDGIQQLVWGLFKKIVIADNCAMVVNNAFGNYEHLPSSSLIIGAILYTVQIYFDFSGYSDIAIGLSKLLGFNVRRNFRYPYFALNVADFWKRWHMSLQSWFMNYIYFPLGGSWGSKSKTICNTLIVFLICGIWHGANWTFIVWGLYHGLLFIPLILFCSKEFRKTTVNENRLLPSIKELVLISLTFVLITIGWVFFNSPSITDAFHYIADMFSSSIIAAPIGIRLSGFAYFAFLIVLVFGMEWWRRSKEYALQFNSPGWLKVIILYILIFHIVFFPAAQSDFIYYQF